MMYFIFDAFNLLIIFKIEWTSVLYVAKLMSGELFSLETIDWHAIPYISDLVSMIQLEIYITQRP